MIQYVQPINHHGSKTFYALIMSLVGKADHHLASAGAAFVLQHGSEFAWLSGTLYRFRAVLAELSGPAHRQLCAIGREQARLRLSAASARQLPTASRFTCTEHGADSRAPSMEPIHGRRAWSRFTGVEHGADSRAPSMEPIHGRRASTGT